MNREEILAMEVGGNLNAEVGREIFGLLQPPFDDKKGYRSYPLYSVDTSAAWQGVEKMEQDGWKWDAIGRIGRRNIEPFKRFYFKPNKYDPVYPLSSIVWADGKQLPEAICKAALLTRVT